MLIVTGATGQLGRRIVEHLLQHVPAERIGVSIRDPDRAADLMQAGVRVRRGDYDDPDSLRHAWEGAERVLLVSSNAAAKGGDPLKQHRAAIEVARELDVGRVLYTSQVSCAPDSHFPPGRHHAATETMLADSGLRWTSMRHGFYASSAIAMNAKGFEAGTLTGPDDGKVAWTTHDDLAAADAMLLARDEAALDGPTPPLTGSEALDLADLAQLATDVLGRPIAREIIEEDALEHRARENGVPESAVAVMLGYYRAARAGEFARVDPTLAQLLGRAPTRMQEFLARVQA